MIVVFTKWKKVDDNSIAWPEVMEISRYSKNELPPRFTAELFDQYMQYVALAGSKMKMSAIVWNHTARSDTGDVLNIRLFVSQEDYNIYKGASDSVEKERNDLLAIMNVERQVKLVTNDETIVNLIGQQWTYDQMEQLFQSVV